MPGGQLPCTILADPSAGSGKFAADGADWESSASLGRREEGRSMRQNRVPDGVPVLSAGRHRRPRKGACFMEFASYLAGEKWSDHPACTHPLLAGIARTVNDLVDSEHRTLLVPLIPDVVGLTGDDLVIDVTLTARCAMAALPVASMDYQRALAVGLLTADRVAATRIVAFSGRGIASAVIMDPDDRLVDLLTACIADTRALVESSAAVPTTVRTLATTR